VTINKALAGDSLDYQMKQLLDYQMKQQRNEGRHAALDSMRSNIDVVGEFSKGQRIQASGISLIYSSFLLAAHTRIEFQTLSSLISE
jgi:hypothetical protein